MYAWFYSHQPLVVGGIVGLALFIAVFLSVVIRQFTPAARQRAADDARLPFEGGAQ